ncbi:uncharacterized protein LOC135814509 [Sycon ciliatum]|uniref:uncharacterized protein LOC135814509 n=1 Tax=Sycon ciliatum TaxID=27933 RepID=UPI0020AD3182|eukprot:scpid30310/ scgid33698/ Ubiquitin thioesterase trabid
MDDSEDMSRPQQRGTGAPASADNSGRMLSAGWRRGSLKDWKETGTTLSVAAPESAAEIRSTATGALRHDTHTGFFCFERAVETTFVLPWDMNPRVQPERFSEKLRTGIRSELLDAAALSILEASGALNWNVCVQWSVKATNPERWVPVDGNLFVELERLYHTADTECSIPALNVVVSFAKNMIQIPGSPVQELRRLACAPLMPLKVDEGDGYSLFHAASMGFWGVHDRTNLLRDAVLHSLHDMKAQFVIYKRWSEDRQIRAAISGTSLLPETTELWETAKQTMPQLYVFSLANVTQRPIIVYASPQSDVGGIYLPLLWGNLATMHHSSDSNTLLKNPLVLGYDSSRNHFVPLCTFKGTKGPRLILLPLVYSNKEPLPVQFLTRQEVPHQNTLLQQLMNVHIHESSAPSIYVEPGSPMKASLPPTLHNQKDGAIPTAVLDTPAMPEVLDSLMKRFETLFL